MITKKEFNQMKEKINADIQKSLERYSEAYKDFGSGLDYVNEAIFYGAVDAVMQAIRKHYVSEAECSNFICQESVEHIQEIPDSDPFYEGHKKACRSAADVAYKMNMKATGVGEVTITEKESGCEYENITQYTLEIKCGETYLNHNGLRYNVEKLIECYCKCAEEDIKGKKKDMVHISQRVENLEKMVEEINKTTGRIFEIIYRG